MPGTNSRKIFINRSTWPCASRAEVDEVVKKATDAVGKQAMEAQDHGFMYGRSFYVLDGHHWEVTWIDQSAMPPR